MKRHAAILPWLWLALAFAIARAPHRSHWPWALLEAPWLLVNGIR